MHAPSPPFSPPEGSSRGPRLDLTVVLVDADWVVERWLVGAGPAAQDWAVAGTSFWELTDGRIPENGIARLRSAMDGRRPDALSIVDPLGQKTIQTIVTPTASGLAIVFQPAVDAAAEDGMATTGREPAADVDDGWQSSTDDTTEPDRQVSVAVPLWLQDAYQEIADCATIDRAFRVAVEWLSQVAGSQRVSLGLLSGERLLIVSYAGYGLIDLLRPLSDPGLQAATLGGTAVRVGQRDSVSWIADDSRVAIHAPFSGQLDDGLCGIVTVEWQELSGGTEGDLDRITQFARILSRALTVRNLKDVAVVGERMPVTPPAAGRPVLNGVHLEAAPADVPVPFTSSTLAAAPAPDQAIRTRRWDPESGCWPMSGMSDRVTLLSGYSVAHLLADPDLWSSRVHPEDRSIAHLAQSVAPESGQRSQAVYRFQRQDGTWSLFQEDSVVFADNGGALINASLVVDITDQQQTVDLLRETELRYRYLVDDLPGIVAYIREFDPQFGTLRTTYISSEIEALTGISPGRWIDDNLNINTLVHPDDREQVMAASAALVDRHADFTHEYRIIRPDGQVRWLRNRVKWIPKPNDHGSGVERWHGVMVDITEQREAEAALRDREARFRLLVEQSPSATLYTQQFHPVTGELTTSYLSPQVTTLTGYDPGDAEVCQPPFLPIVHPDDRELVLAQLPGESREDGRSSTAYRITHRGGQIRWLRNMVQRDPLPSADGTVTWRGIVIDVTEQRVAAESAHTQDIRMRSVVEQASEILIVTDHFGVPTFVSQAFEAILGYTIKEQVRTTLERFVHPDHLDEFAAELRRIRATPGARFSGVRVKVQHANQSWRWLEVSGINKEDQPEIGGIVITARDVTDQVLAEESLRDRESLLSTLVRHAADFITVISTDHTVTYASPSSLAFLGESGGVANLTVPSDLLRKEDHDRFMGELRRLAEHPGAKIRFETEVRRADGEWRWIRMVITNHTGTPGIHGYLINGHDMTDYREAEQRLRDSEDRFRSLFRHAPDIVMVLDPDGLVLFASPSVAVALGDAMTKFVDRETQLRFHPDDFGTVISQFDRALENPSEAVSFEARVRHQSGIWLWWEITVTNLLSHASVGGLVLNARDITWRKQAEGLLRESEERFRLLVQHGSDLTMLVGDDGAVSFVTPSSQRILGFAPDEIEGKTDFDWISRSDRPQFDELLQQSRRRPEPAGPIVISFRHADGSWRDLQIIATSLLNNRNVRGIVINAHDVTERRSLEQQLIHQAYHDPLTGLPNRALFNERLIEARLRAHTTNESFAVIFLDLDDFKVVNDTLGHIAGDQLLRTVADRLSVIARGDDVVARMGGDEFTILIEELHDVASAEAFADRVIRRLQEPVIINGHEVLVSPCLGIAIGRPGDDSGHDLLREADIAMYEAKSRGKGQRVIYDDNMNSQAWARMQLQGELRRAISLDQLRVHYQPQVELTTGRITEFEALIRWDHPTRGLIAPHDFIPVAEETGMIVSLGQFVLEQACTMAGGWNRQRRERGLDPLMISVNLSARQFLHPDLVGDVTQVLTATGLEPGLLRLEITESVALNDFAATTMTMRTLRGLGVRLAIDDFGTGYSGLNYLRECPIDTIKIDRSYTNGLGSDSSDTAMIHAVMAFATTLGLDVCAEGIEREEQVQQLRAVGCHRGQGFYFSGPLPGETVTAMLKTDPLWALGFWSTHDVASDLDQQDTLAH